MVRSVTKAVELCVLTRGLPRGEDYHWLPAAPSGDPKGRWRGLTSFERGSLVFRAHKPRCELLISGLPTTRHDDVGTPIFNTLYVAGAINDVGTHMANLVDTWLASCGPDAKGTVTDLADRVAEVISSDSLEAPHGDDVTYLTLLIELTDGSGPTEASPTPALSDGEVHLFGDLGNKSHRGHFKVFVRDCINSGYGEAAVLNLVASAKEVSSQRETPQCPMFVLGVDTDAADSEPHPLTWPEKVEHLLPKELPSTRRTGLLEAAAAAIVGRAMNCVKALVNWLTTLLKK